MPVRLIGLCCVVSIVVYVCMVYTVVILLRGQLCKLAIDPSSVLWTCVSIPMVIINVLT